MPETPGGRTLALNTIILLHRDAEDAREPLFVLAGGPGQAATRLKDYFAAVTDASRRAHDVVILDQRGTNGQTRLDCIVAPRTFFVPADSHHCLERLGRQADLTAYGTQNFVHDLEAARAALGYERISLFGVSLVASVVFADGRWAIGVFNAESSSLPFAYRSLEFL